MTSTTSLRCRCGDVTGVVTPVSPSTRVVCHCDDCQAFAHHLGRPDLLDEHAGSDIVQIAPASLSFVSGDARIVGLRLSPKGLIRWYADCCETPLGNMVSTGVPVLGIHASAFPEADAAFGKPIGAILGKFAVGTPPEGSTKLNPRILARVARLLLGWKLGGKAWPHPFYDRKTREPTHPLHVISRAEREALRAKCGPRPTA